MDRYHWKKEHVDTMVDIATLLGAKSIGVTSEIRRTVDFAQQLHEVMRQSVRLSILKFSPILLHLIEVCTKNYERRF